MINDFVDVAKIKTVKARKQHTCYGCCNVIEAKSNYIRMKTLCDSTWSNEKSCLKCYEIIEKISEINGFTLLPSYLYEYLDETSQLESDLVKKEQYTQLFNKLHKRLDKGYRNRLNQIFSTIDLSQDIQSIREILRIKVGDSIRWMFDNYIVFNDDIRPGDKITLHPYDDDKASRQYIKKMKDNWTDKSFIVWLSGFISDQMKRRNLAIYPTLSLS